MLGFNVGVILLGALVRATGSGAGCGRSWPTCQGEIIPSLVGSATQIEFLHRATSGVALFGVLMVYLAARRLYSKGAPARTAAFVAGIAIVGEAMIGAGIVLFEWVAEDSSVARTVAVPLHLVNTLLLLASLSAVVYLSDGRRFNKPTGELRTILLAGGTAMLIVAATGAVAALADTLFPSESLVEGLVQDFDATSSFLTRVRIVHPIVAIAVGLLLVWIVTRADAVQPVRTSPAARAVPWIVALQVLAGFVNVGLLVPVWTQLVHLFLADALWVSFVWFALEALEAQSNATSSS